jgi:hypothetical protein
MAGRLRSQHNNLMPAWSTYSYAFGPLVAVLAIGLFVLVLRWSSKKGSLVAAPPRQGQEGAYGLLVVISRPPDYVSGELQRRTLEDANIRATLVYTTDGPRVMVWPEDERIAGQVLASNSSN